MNHLEGSRTMFAQNFEQNVEQNVYGRAPHIVSTVALLLAGYVVISFFDVWPSTTKRAIYEFAIYATPSRLIYFAQQVMAISGHLSDQNAVFELKDFGQFKAKEEALKRIVGNSPIPRALKRARTSSGCHKSSPMTNMYGPPGLGNWDNSCYQNSILQGLASLSAFQHYIYRNLMLNQRTRLDASTIAALTSFLDQLSDTTGPKQTIWTPRILKSMNSWQQQDAQEYYSRIVEAVEKETVNYAKAAYGSTNCLLTGIHAEEPVHGSKKVEAVKKVLQTLGGQPMDGMFAQALTCQTCGFSEGISLTQFNCLTVNLGLGGSRTVEDLMDEYTEPELIEGVECDNCTRLALKTHKLTQENVRQENVRQEDVRQEDMREDTVSLEKAATTKETAKKELRVKAKQITFGRLPKNLVIHVNRSIWDDYGNQVKNTSSVYFQPRLAFLDRWCVLPDADLKLVQAVYELKCIVTHSGRHDDGHYVAYGKRDKGWYCFNDDIVMALDEAQVLMQGNVFMLFYEEMSMDDGPGLSVSEVVEMMQGTAEGAVDVEAEAEAEVKTEVEVEAEVEAGVGADDLSETTSSLGKEVEGCEESTANIARPVVPVTRTAELAESRDDSIDSTSCPYAPAA